jgi:hypothetical protein
MKIATKKIFVDCTLQKLINPLRKKILATPLLNANVYMLYVCKIENTHASVALF